MDGGLAADGEYDIRFLLYDDLGAVVAGPICHDNVMVVGGVFSVQIDFGDQFFGDVRELELAVRAGGTVGNCDTGGGYSTLSPRQEITASPYALGLRLPYAGMQSDAESIFSIVNTNADAESAILGIIGDTVEFPFKFGAGVRGEGGAGNAGVVGLSEKLGVYGYGAGLNGIGIVGLTDGSNGVGVWGQAFEDGGIGVIGTAPENGWAAQFNGRSVFFGNVGVGIQSPTASLDVDGTTRTTALEIPTNAGAGKVLTSDASGNATWQTPGANDLDFNEGDSLNPTDTVQFLAVSTTVTITEGQNIFVASSRAFGTTSVGGASGLWIDIGFRVSGSSDIPSVLGDGLFNLQLPQDSRVPFSINGIITGLAAGTYEVGMVGRNNGGTDWNSNDYGYTSAIVLD